MSAFAAVSDERVLSPAVEDLFAANRVALPTVAQVDRILYGTGIHSRISADAAELLSDEEETRPFTDRAWVYKRGNASERLAFYTLSRLLNPAADATRQRLLACLPTETGSPFDGETLSRKTGVHTTTPRGWEPLEALICEAQQGFRIDQGRAAEVNPGKTFMTTGQLPGSFYASAALKLAQHPSILRFVGRYLDGFPTLFRINLLRSSNEYLQEGSSQFFHIDPEDWRQMKIFILIEDVDVDSGPLHLLSAEAGDEFRVKTGYRQGRLNDEDVLSVVGGDRLTQCIGPQGTMVFGDTSRCFHFGSRPGKRERYIVMIQYISPFAASFMLGTSPIKCKYAAPYLQQCVAAGEEPQEFELRLFGAVR